MADYKTETEWFWERQEALERRGKHADNLTLLSAHCHLPSEQVTAFIRARHVKVTRDGKVIARSSDFGDAPAGLTDEELVAWAVQKISN